jgi:uncharacterized phage protein (TIGR01671 family)
MYDSGDVCCVYGNSYVEVRDGLSIRKLEKNAGDVFYVMQYIGRKDECGKMIYEGDIVEFRWFYDECDESRKGVVVYDDKNCRYVIVCVYGGGIYDFQFDEVCRLKVLGNIFEHGKEYLGYTYREIEEVLRSE